MKRLTRRWGADQPNIVGRAICTFAECPAEEGCDICNHARVNNRLADIKDILGDNYDLDRIRELAEADREGRCVVLPCKKGDTVWRIVNDATTHITKDHCTDIKIKDGYVWVYLIGDRVMASWNFGELLFLTREEAEAALAKEST